MSRIQTLPNSDSEFILGSTHKHEPLAQDEYNRGHPWGQLQ